MPLVHHIHLLDGVVLTLGRKVISFLRAPEMVEMRNPVPPLWWLENHVASALVMVPS